MPSLVSVIIPAYNCASFVAEAVQSALDQDYEPKEIIVVNDGSSDGTLAVLRGFRDSIRLIDQKNSGPPVARNAGLVAARGDYIAFLDADDVWMRSKLTTQVAYLDSHPEVGTVFTAWFEWRPDPDGSFRRPKIVDPPVHALSVDAKHSGWLYNRLLFECDLLTTTVMLRASVVRIIGNFDITMFNGDDYDYWIRASRVAQISKLKCVGALYRILPTSVSRKLRAPNFEYEVIRKALSRWGPVGPDGTETDAGAINRRLAELAIRHGYAHLHDGDVRLGLAVFLDTLRRNPANPKLWIYAARAIIKASVRLTGARKVSK